MIAGNKFTVPANTPESSAITLPLVVHAGTLSKLSLYFPPGSCGLMGVSVHLQGVQIFPYNRDAFLYGNDIKFDDTLELEIPSEHPVLDIVTYNKDILYSHSFFLTATIFNKEIKPDISALVEQNEIIIGILTALYLKSPEPSNWLEKKSEES